MRRSLPLIALGAATAAALGVAVYAMAVTPQKALVYCPVAIDRIGCHNVVAALLGPNGPFPNGVDRGYDGTAGTVDLATADLSPYAVFIIPSLADDSASKPYDLLRNSRIAYRLSVVLQGRLIVWSGTPDQGTQNRDLKDKLIRNLAVWARGADSAAAPGLVVLGDHSEVASQRYAWLTGFAGLAVSPDTVAQVYDSVKTLTATGIAILDNGGTQLAYAAMASFGVQPPAAASGAAVDARGGSAEGQVVLVTSPQRLASVKTDKPDYSPGETVTFTGSGWEPGEVVSLLLHEDTTLHADRTLTATADPLGNMFNNEFKPEPHDVGVTFYVTASGETSGLAAQTRFTDGTVKVMSAPAGVTFTLTWTIFSTTACTGTVTSSGTATVGSSGGGVFSKNVGNTESIKLEASATSNQGGAFASWSGPAGTFTTDPLNPRIICVPGTFSGNREYTATYSAPNTPPTVAANNASVTVNEGQTASNTGTYSDPNTGDNVTITASVGTVIKTGTNSGTWSWSFSTTDGPTQSQTVTITANDGHGGVANTTFSLTVNNVAPTVATPTVTLEPSAEGSSATASASFSDPAGAADAPFTCTVNYGDGSGAQAGTGSGSSCNGPAHTYTDNGAYTVTVAVTDKDGGTGSNATTHGVTNVAPTVAAPSVTPTSTDEGLSTAFTVSASFSDPAGAADAPFTCTVAWGDGTSSPGTVSGFTCTFSGNHTYAQSGSYNVTVVVTGKDGGGGNNPGNSGA